MHPEDLINKKVQLKHKIVGTAKSEGDALIYIIERQTVSFLTNGKSSTELFQLKLPLDKLVCDDAGIQLLQRWHGKQHLRDETFSLQHRIIDQKVSNGRMIYEVERESSRDEVKSPTKIFQVPLDTIHQSENGADLLIQWSKNKGSWF